MREGVTPIQEEGPILVPAQKIQGTLGDDVGGILSLLPAPVPRKLEFALVVPQELGVVTVRVYLVQITEKLVEPLASRSASRTRVSEAPFTEAAGCIAGLPKLLRDSNIVGFDGRCPRVRTNGSVPPVESGHQHRSRGSANGGAGITVGEP